MNKLRDRANKEISHLSFDRHYVGSIEKKWNILLHLKELVNIIKFFLTLLDDYYINDEILRIKHEIIKFDEKLKPYIT